MSLAADDIIGANLLLGSSGMINAPRCEVGFVAAIVMGGVREIARAWEPLLSSAGFSLKMSGVFCHAAPMVRFRRPPSITVETKCELADLLVVVDCFQSGVATRVAFLIQAKMASKAQRVSLKGKSSKRQLSLYQYWPIFSFVDSVYGSASFDLSAQGVGEAGTFGVIDRHFKNKKTSPPVWTQHSASPTPTLVSSEPTLGRFLANAVGRTGPSYGRQAFANGTDDWSKVVDLLMSVTYRKAFRHQPTLGTHAAMRGTTALAFLGAAPSGVSALVSRGEPRLPFDGIDVIEDDDPGGISLLRVVVAETGDREG